MQQLIERYKRMRTEHYLSQTYQYQYAFVGMGQHSLTNLYPVLHYLGVPLKYICVTSERKAKLIEKKFPGVNATTSLDEILNDDTVKGVFVAASPSAHFSIASQVLRKGKSLFVEKPPCQTLEELDALIDEQRLYGSHVAMVGLQKRYAPAVQILRHRLSKERLVSYDLHYLTGAYPEGDALLDLYIHPLDLILCLFGPAEIMVREQNTTDSYVLMLRHSHIVGTVELSTAVAWDTAEESLKVSTASGIYRLSQMEELTFSPKPTSILGIPVEKVHPHHKSMEYLYTRNNFLPILTNNQIHSQGYFNEIVAFVDSIEDKSGKVLTGLQSIKDIYRLISTLKKQ